LVTTTHATVGDLEPGETRTGSTYDQAGPQAVSYTFEFQGRGGSLTYTTPRAAPRKAPKRGRPRAPGAPAPRPPPHQAGPAPAPRARRGARPRGGGPPGGRRGLTPVPMPGPPLRRRPPPPRRLGDGPAPRIEDGPAVPAGRGRAPRRTATAGVVRAGQPE